MAKSAKKKKPVEEVADRLGFSYSQVAAAEVRDRFRDLPEIPRMASIKHVLDGVLDDRGLVIFESGYIIPTGQGNVQVAYTVYACEAPDWPKTHITPRNIVGRVLALFGRGSAVELEDRSFNRRFKVSTEHEGFAITLLSPDMQAFMLTKSVRWRIDPGRVCLIYSGALKSSRIEASLQRMQGFWSRVAAELEAW